LPWSLTASQLLAKPLRICVGLQSYNEETGRLGHVCFRPDAAACPIRRMVAACHRRRCLRRLASIGLKVPAFIAAVAVDPDGPRK